MRLARFLIFDLLTYQVLLFDLITVMIDLSEDQIDMMRIVVVASLLLRTLIMTHCKDVIAAGHNRHFLLGRTLMDEGELVYFSRSS
jgi:hypothetical protein